MKFPTDKELQRLRREFPSGCRIVLDEMEDVQAPKLGTQGVCRGVDDAGNILASWDGGGSLNVAYGADTCHRVASESEIRESLDWLGRSRHRGAKPQGGHHGVRGVWNCRGAGRHRLYGV